MYPDWLHGSRTAFLAAVDALRCAEPNIRVLVEPFEDDPAMRTRRSRPRFERSPSDIVQVSAAQRAAFEHIDVALALDLPFDIAVLAPRLRWVQAVGTGVGHLRTAGLAEAGVRLTTAAGTASPEIAEFVMARILEHMTDLPVITKLQSARTWQPRYGRAVAGATVGLVGFGTINRSVADLAAAFGMHVRVSRRTGSIRGTVDEAVEVFGPEELAEMVAPCDVVVAALPETPETVGIFDTEFFAQMQPGALFCNVGRGTAVRDEALIDALRSGRLGAAALDVFNAEPLDPDDPYWTTPGLRISAHGASVPSASIRRVHELFLVNLARFMADEPLRNELDPVRGY